MVDQGAAVSLWQMVSQAGSGLDSPRLALSVPIPTAIPMAMDLFLFWRASIERRCGDGWRIDHGRANPTIIYPHTEAHVARPYYDAPVEPILDDS